MARCTVKAALVALLLYAVVRRDLPQFEGKGVVARALLYPTAALCLRSGSHTAAATATRSTWTCCSCFPSSSTDSPELRTAYTDTLGDLMLGGIAGSTVAALATATVFYPRRP